MTLPASKTALLLSLVMIACWSVAPAEAQTWGQRAPSVPTYVNPRVPLGSVGRAVVAATERAALPAQPGQPGLAPVVVVVVVPNIIVRPSEVTIDPPQIHFVPDAPETAPPSVLATGTAPK